MSRTSAVNRRRDRLRRLKAAAYVRRPAEDQHASVENQREQILSWAKQRGVRISHIYEER